MSDATQVHRYPAHFEPDLDMGGFVVSFRDLPEAITQGDDEAEATFMAEDVLAMVVDDYLAHGRRLPPPSLAQPGERVITAQYHGWDGEEDAEEVE